ncbi:MAG: DcrB-related protein [Prevotella sp.]|nr:DcrB-related protein [Prevotella sp.]
MNKRLLFGLFGFAVVISCKDPREKTVWDYIDSDLASEYEFHSGVEALHRDLIKHGYMEEHSCDLLECTSTHQNTYADIERVHNILNKAATIKDTKLAEAPTTSPKENITAIETEINTKLDNRYSNGHFSLCYPSSWQIVQDDNQVTANTSIAVQIMEKPKNDVDFRPNINIIVSNKKWEESALYLARQTSQNNKQLVSNYKQLGISNTQISGCKGCLLESSIELQGYTLHSSQYIVKKADNTTLIITATTDNRKHKEQMKVISEILKSIQIK